MSTPPSSSSSSSSKDPVNVGTTSSAANTISVTAAAAAAATTILPSLSALPRDALLSILSQLHPSDVERLEQAVPDVSIHTHDPVLWRHFYHTLISSRRTAMAPRPYLVVRGDGRLDWRGAFHEARRRESAISVARQQRLARFQQQQQQQHRKHRAGEPSSSSTAANVGTDSDEQQRNNASPTTGAQQQQQTTTPRRAGYRVERTGNVRRIIATDYHSSGTGESGRNHGNNHPFIVWDAHLALNRFDWSNHPRDEQQQRQQDSTGNLSLRRKRATNPIQPSRTVYKRNVAGEGDDGDDGSGGSSSRRQ